MANEEELEEEGDIRLPALIVHFINRKLRSCTNGVPVGAVGCISLDTCMACFSSMQIQGYPGSRVSRVKLTA